MLQPDSDREPTVPCEVLIVEDNADGRKALRLLLRRMGYRVEEAEDGREGVRKGLALRPRAAVVDIGLPLLDGFGVARRLRDELGRGVLLIAHTACTAAGEEASDLFDAWLRKPADPRVLLDLLGKAA